MVTLAPRATKNAQVPPRSNPSRGAACRKWLELDAANLSGKVLALPGRDDVNFPIQEQLIVELYSK